MILDLHWNSDDIEFKGEMAMRGQEAVGDSVDFWHSVADQFKDNELVFYELFNEPHLQQEVTNEVYLHGDDTYVGMLGLIDTVRAHSQDQVLIIGGAKNWAYDTESLKELDALTDDTLIMYNYHMYMHPGVQQDYKGKNVDRIEAHVIDIQGATDKPTIFTEFG